MMVMMMTTTRMPDFGALLRTTGPTACVLPPRLVSLLLLLLLLVVQPPAVQSLECYICTDQDENNAKCTSTLRLCEPHQDRCMTEVRWGSTPYWAPTGEKQFYISKWCANQTVCDYTIRRQSKRCDRIWYNDWECSECCTGDRCNYYVTLGASSAKASLLLLVMASAGTLSIGMLGSGTWF